MANGRWHMAFSSLQPGLQSEGKTFSNPQCLLGGECCATAILQAQNDFQSARLVCKRYWRILATSSCSILSFTVSSTGYSTIGYLASRECGYGGEQNAGFYHRRQHCGKLSLKLLSRSRAHWPKNIGAYTAYTPSLQGGCSLWGCTLVTGKRCMEATTVCK